MSDIPFHYLETLEKYKIPNKQEKVRIRFGESSQEPGPATVPTEGPTTVPSEGPSEALAFNPIKIFDRRKTSTLDYASVMNRLRDKDVFIVKTSAALPSIPVSETPKPAKKPFVIRDSILVAKEKKRSKTKVKKRPKTKSGPNVNSKTKTMSEPKSKTKTKSGPKVLRN